MITVTPSIAIDEGEIKQRFIRASGPGGQNVNTVSTAVQLRFDVGGSAALTDDVRRRLIHLAGRRMTLGGVLVIEAQRFRSRERNRRDALERLVALIREAAEEPKPRRKTRPSKASRRRLREAKRRRGEIKRARGPVKNDD